jgi:hypothetical protein
MKFTCIPKLGKSGGGKVWDNETNKVFAVFDSNGELETDDATVIQKLKALGYQSLEGPAPVELPKKTKKSKKEIEAINE